MFTGTLWRVSIPKLGVKLYMVTKYPDHALFVILCNTFIDLEALELVRK